MADFLLWFAGLILTWVVIAIPTYFAAKLIVGNKATIWRAMITTLIGPIIYGLFLFFGSLISFLIPSLTVVAAIVAFLAWVWVFRRFFRTSWLRAIGIDVLSTIISWAIFSILGLIGVTLIV